MDSGNLAIGILFLLQNIVGILGNFRLLSYYLVLYNKENMVKPTDLILTHLNIANSLMILFHGVPHTIATFGLKQLFSDLGCSLSLYIYRVGRGMSLSSTCLLSVFQAITMSPRNSCWKDLKVKAPKYVRFSISLCWILYVLVNFIFPLYLHTTRNIKNLTKKRDYEYCSTIGSNKITELLYVALLVTPEVLLSGLIIWSSGSMVVILYTHKQQVQYIHSYKISSRTSPESRATRSILTLVSTFLAFYTLSSILHGCIALLNNTSPWLIKISQFISLSFPTIGPFIMNYDCTVPSSAFCTHIRNLE
uniref:vomeronasal type-1 receptor 4-like n=1 Tax=Jaculus jaculus TaxID=51337 RepID=UPI001E1B4582